jgi:hypothetical protein
LPYNDLDENGYAKSTQKLIPWYGIDSNKSILKNRWIKIIKDNKVVYAQWEDSGPFLYDDFSYVFGSNRPSNRENESAGLDVSPAVKLYLGLNDIDKVSWQFIDYSDVPDGVWKDIITTDSKLSPKSSWYWQLSGEINQNIPAKVYDIDLFKTSKETIEQLHQKDKVVICYFSAGSYEDWREDSYKFHKEELGEELDGWEDERWLDIRSQNVKRIMIDRLHLAKEKGCDGVEPDNVDGYDNNSGFNLTYSDQIAYNKFLANYAHKLGLLIGLKNDLEQIKDLVYYFDFGLNEKCYEHNECNLLIPFINQNKPVFNAEYSSRYIVKSLKTYVKMLWILELYIYLLI